MPSLIVFFEQILLRMTRLKVLFVTVFIVWFGVAGQAQDNVKVYAEQTEQGFAVYADNTEHCPVSVLLQFEMQNMKLTTANKDATVVLAQTKKILLAEGAIIDRRKPSKYAYTYYSNYGNDAQTEYDKDYVYDLPFEKGNSFMLYQGYNGTFSHQNEYSLDFTMPVGTPITAIRDGIVVKLVEKNVLVCPKIECVKYNNYVLVYHSDGTFAEYSHIKRDGVLVNVGDPVTKGQVIALSGNTGFSSGPHLHFLVFLQKIKSRQSLATPFRIGDGNTNVFLKEKETYSREY